METRNVKRKTNDRCAPLPKKWGRWICRCVCCQFFFWAVEDQRCGEALELGGHGHRNPPRCHADTRSDLDHDSGIPLQISTEIRTMYPNHVKRWGPHPERCPRLSRQAGQQGILTEPHMKSSCSGNFGLDPWWQKAIESSWVFQGWYLIRLYERTLSCRNGEKFVLERGALAERKGLT